MSYDERLAARIRAVLAERGDVLERKMFGGLCFLVGGAMCCGIAKSDFMVRVGPELYEEALAQPHARPMDFTGRPLKGMVYVAPAGLRSRASLERWVNRALTFLATLPPPSSSAKRRFKPQKRGRSLSRQAMGRRL